MRISMKKLVLIFSSLLLSLLLSSSKSGQPVLFKLNKTTSTIQWKSTQENESHEGKIEFKSGNTKWDSQTLLSAYAIINMQKITCTDIKDSGFNREQVVEMRSPEQLNLIKYKDAKIRITKAKRLDVPSGSPNYEVSGTVTIKGISVPVESTITIVKSKKSAILKGVFNLPEESTELPYQLALEFDIHTSIQK